MTNQKSIAEVGHLSIIFYVSASVLIYLKQILIPFVVAVFLYFISKPLISWLQVHLKTSRMMSLGITLSMSSFILGSLIVLVLGSVRGFFEDIEQYKQTVIGMIDQVNFLVAKLGFEHQLDTLSLDSVALSTYLEELPIWSYIGRISQDVVSILTNVFMVCFYYLFMVIGDSGSVSHPDSGIKNSVVHSIQRYITTKTLISFMTGLFVGLIFWFIGIQMALTLAVLTFVFNFIPSIGSIFATLLPLPIALLQFGFSMPFWLSLALPGAVQFFFGNIVEPRLLGQGLGLHPITVMLALVIWGSIWGVAGMFLAVPLTACIRIACEEVESLKKISKVLAGEI